MTSRGTSDYQLVFAVRRDDVGRVKDLLEMGASVNARDEQSIVCFDCERVMDTEMNINLFSNRSGLF